MVAAPDDIHSYLREQAEAIFARRRPPEEIRLSRATASIFLARCRFADGTETAIVKRMPPRLGAGSLVDLCQLHRQVRERSEIVSDRAVRFLGYDDRRSLLVLEEIRGRPLSRLVGDALGGDGAEPAAELDQLADFLRALHSLSTSDLEVSGQPRPNREFITDLVTAWRSAAIRRWLPPRFASPQPLLDRLPVGFWERAEARLLAVDFQPKNVLVSEDRGVRVIDIDYSWGHPAQNLAKFLINLDLLVLPRPTRRRLEQTARWKRRFLDRYFEGGRAGAWIAEDLEFFYPWAILRLYRDHLRRRGRWKPLLAWLYARLLADFLRAVEGAPSASTGLVADLPGPSLGGSR